jgi:hypothetical protein
VFERLCEALLFHKAALWQEIRPRLVMAITGQAAPEKFLWVTHQGRRTVQLCKLGARTHSAVRN